MRRCCFFGLLILLGLSAVAYGGNVSQSKTFAYVTDDFTNAVSIFALNPSTGALTPAGSIPTKPTPHHIIATPNGKFLYVASRTAHCICGYSVNPATGALTAIAGSPYAAGTGPTSIVLDLYSKYLYAVNEGDSYGSVSAYAVNPTTGKLTPLTGNPYPAGKGSYAAAIDPTGKYLYVVNSGENNVSGFAVDQSSGQLTPLAGGPFPTGGNIPTSITVKGRFCFVANQLSHSVAAFVINPANGKLSPVGGSPFNTVNSPVWLAADSSGKRLYVVGQGTGSGNDSTVSLMSINPTTGALLTIIGGGCHAGNSAHQIVFDPTGKFAYVTNHGGDISGFSVHPATGILSPLSGSPFGSLEYVSIATVKTTY